MLSHYLNIRTSRAGHYDVHSEAIRRLTNQVPNHASGIAEWCKNSYAAYLRDSENPNPEDKLIVIFLVNGARSRRVNPVIACLDFGGMTSDQIRKWNTWGDPNATTTAARSFSGHGTGGKSYMLHYFGRASLVSVKSGKLNVRFFQNTTGSSNNDRVTPRISAEDDDIPESNPTGFLKSIIKEELRIEFEHLPEHIKSRIESNDNYTLILGEDPNHINRSTIPGSEITGNLNTIPQMQSVINSCSVAVIRKRSESSVDYEPLSGVNLDIIYEKTFPIPTTLTHPETHEELNTGANDNSLLVVSQNSSLLTRSTKPYNKVWYYSNNGVVGETEMDYFGRHPLYKTLHVKAYLDALPDRNCVSEMRQDLNNNEFAHAFKDWIDTQLSSVINDLDAIEDRETREEHREQNLNLITDLNTWKNNFLEEALSLGGDGDDNTGNNERPTTNREQYPRRPVTRISLSQPGNGDSGIGVRIPINMQFYGENGERVRPVPIEWLVSDPLVCTNITSQTEIATTSSGLCSISVRSSQGVVSNEIKIRVLDIATVKSLEPNIINIGIGQRRSLHTLCIDDTGNEYQDIRLIWASDDETIVDVGEAGRITGHREGTTDIYAGDDSNTDLQHIATVNVISHAGSTSRFPEVYLSEDQKGPYEEIQRLRPREGHLVQRLQDVNHNIWWINKRSSLADYLITTFGENSTEWRLYVLKCFIEMIARIIVNIRLSDGDIEPSSFDHEWTTQIAEIHSTADEEFYNTIIYRGNMSLINTEIN